MVDLPRFKSGEVQFDDRNKIAETPLSLLRKRQRRSVERKVQSSDSVLKGVGKWQDQLVAVKIHKIDSQVFHVQPESLREVKRGVKRGLVNCSPLLSSLCSAPIVSDRRLGREKEMRWREGEMERVRRDI